MKAVQKVMIMLFQLNGLAYSIYYYLENSDIGNLAWLICQALIILIVILIQSRITQISYIGSLFALQLSLICQIVCNQKNEHSSSFPEVIIIHFITTHSFEDLIRQENYQILARYKMISMIFLLQSTMFIIVYISLTEEITLSFTQGIVFLLLSLLLNFDRIASSDTRAKSYSTCEQNVKSDQAIFRRERISSLAESEKISPENTSSHYLQMFRSDNTKSQAQLNSNILDVTMQYTHEGLIVLKRNLKDQHLQITYANTAAKALFQINSSKEILEILYQFQNLSYVHHDCQEEITLKINNQQNCKSNVFLKSDFLASSVKYNFQFQGENHSSKNYISNFTELFDKFQCNNYHEYFVINAYFPNQAVTISQMEKKLDKMIELTIAQRENNQFFILIRDITHRQKIRYLREYDIQKSKMLSYVSHEYRSPLNCIIQMIENIAHSKQLNPDNQEMLQAALDSSYYILNLSNDLLDLAQIKNGKFATQRSQFNLEHLIKECLKLFALKAKIISLDLQYTYDIQASTVIISDRNRLKQILVNLLSNSFKFAAGKIQIVVKCIDDNTLRIGVQDDGIGISEEDQKKLFRSFSKVNSEESRKRNEQGVGLGLVISNQIAFSMGCGGLQLESKPNQGTHFYLDLQIQSPRLKKVSSYRIREVSVQAQEVDEASTFNVDYKISQELGPPSKCSHILIVDDEVFNVFTFTKLLNIKNIIDIDSASNGNECLEKVRNKKCCEFCTGYKIIFMDIDMPILNGQNAARLLLESNPSLIIIACSGYTDHSEKDKCIQIGMVDYIVKPIKDQELSYVLRTYYV